MVYRCLIKTGLVTVKLATAEPCASGLTHLVLPLSASIPTVNRMRIVKGDGMCLLPDCQSCCSIFIIMGQVEELWFPSWLELWLGRVASSNDNLSWFQFGHGGSSSGSTSDYRSRGRGFDSCWELGFFSLFCFSSFNQLRILNQVPSGGATLLILQKFPQKMKACLCSLRQSKLNTHLMSEKTHWS